MARILVVDADAPVRALTRRILVLEDHDVTDVASGSDALAAVARDRFDVILLDVDLPGEKGYDVLDRLRALDDNVAIIVVAAGTTANGSLREARAGAIDHITKPFGFGELKSAVERVVSSTPEQLRELRVIRSNAADRLGPIIRLEEGVRPKRRLLRRR